jgi:hypothetical protein
VIAPLLLGGFAVAMAILAPWALRRSAWTRQAPALGILAWQASSAAVLIAAILAGTVLAVPTLPITTDLADWLGACSLALRERYATPGGAATATAGVIVAAAIMLRLVSCLAVGWFRVTRTRRSLRANLALLASQGTQPGVWVVEHPEPAAYGLPGREGRVVVSRGAIEALDGQQLAAVLAHERAHLGDRHDLVLVTANALRRGFGIVPLFRWAETEIADLVEMRADDAALGSVGRRTLAGALVALAGARHPAGSLGVGGSLAVVRVRRLAAPGRSLGAVRSVATVAGCLAVLAVPVAVAVGPAVTAAAMDYCPVVFPG